VHFNLQVFLLLFLVVDHCAGIRRSKQHEYSKARDFERKKPRNGREKSTEERVQERRLTLRIRERIEKE